MATFFARRGGPRRPSRPAVPRVGHFYLAAAEQKLHCLNETARQLAREGIPLTVRDLTRQPLLTPEGHLVAARDLPLNRCFRDEKPVESVFHLQRPDGAVQVLAWHVSPMRDFRGEVIGVMGSLTLPPPEPDWEELAGLAHDLRTPLQTIRNLIAVVETSNLLGHAAEAVNRLRSTTERAMSLGKDLVDFCKAPQLGAPRGSRVWQPLGPMLEKLVGEHSTQAQKKEISLVLAIEAASTVEIHTDVGRMMRLIGNLLANAIRYTSKGRVALSSERQTNGDLMLVVEDTGAGIAAEDPESIFGAFKRGKAGRSESDSTGLGLSVVDRLVSELEFTLEVYSEFGQGSRFELNVPAAVVRSLGGKKKDESRSRGEP